MTNFMAFLKKDIDTTVSLKKQLLSFILKEIILLQSKLQKVAFSSQTEKPAFRYFPKTSLLCEEEKVNIFLQSSKVYFSVLILLLLVS